MKKIPILFAMITILFLGCSSKNGSKNETSKPEPLKITDRVIMETTEGSITLGLYCNAMPVTCNNFKRYISEGFYKGLVFHRVIDGFMIQGGGFTADLQQKKGHEPISLETSPHISHKAFTLSMARTMDPHSATSQFFITVADTPHLDARKDRKTPNGYAAFGIVIEGKEIVKKIAGVKTNSQKGHRDVPATPVTIKNVTLKR